MRLMITRPEEDAHSLAIALANLGVESIMEPLLAIEFIDGPSLPLDDVQALLFTSANGVRAFVRWKRDRAIRCFAVGAATAGAALGAGFAAVEVADGDVNALVELVRSRLSPSGGTLLHIAGSAVAGDLGGMLAAAGFSYRRVVLYRAIRAKVFSIAGQQALRSGMVDGVVLYSPRTARTFVGLVREADLEGACRKMTAYCLSQAVADEVPPLAWERVVVGDRPDQQAMLASFAQQT
ncbi:MAG: uroporphyrinogen-III synthase [Rhodospirillales bacterium]|nr:uroporphyrinogen-III synthase [Rhodospirillales bacterium]